MFIWMNINTNAKQHNEKNFSGVFSYSFAFSLFRSAENFYYKLLLYFERISRLLG